jgi:hypothetical protein
MLRRCAPALLLLAFVGCREDFAPSRDAIVGTWELESISGFPDCTLVTGGELEVGQDNDGDFFGDFEFSRDCPMGGGTITERATLDSLDIEQPEREYSMELQLIEPEQLLVDWECSLAEPDLECIESGDPVLIFEFRREP